MKNTLDNKALIYKQGIPMKINVKWKVSFLEILVCVISIACALWIFRQNYCFGFIRMIIETIGEHMIFHICPFISTYCI